MIVTFIGHRKLQFDGGFMIDKAALCIFYYDEHYKPPLKPAARGRIAREQPKSGTKVAYEYAIRRQKELINLFSRSSAL